ncbi:MAG: acetyl-CoA carboxylase biotin carboxylase subunit [Candidatus Aminicenantes bacterium RBG_13_63_10]|nr:MAG: acetyl-CoA carboxylase biotin carboxylase subunit [Candidatus Aminicenantes bacterium RBG_13_63_10]
MKAEGKLFDKILIANRGEIAVRVIRACRELGIRSVAVYSEADRAALHCQMADEAVPIGPSPSLESYLNMDRIIEAARRTGCQAIHPGYGFLAENAEFCRRCEKEGIVFIGPKSAALELVGDKVRARQAMEKAGVPIIPGMKNVAADIEECVVQARKIGFPVMVKASAGGGGKGMRIVCGEDELRPALEAGRREAKSAFGDDSVYLEKYIEEPRHVEFQVLADGAGNTVHLFERECSIQRRHQKIIEESPSPALDPELRAEMGETARKVMMTAGYNNAGTVEFLLDRDKKFYFLEVNARLQVEHPVTEMVTGVDLVQQQITIASGRKFELRQEELRQRGHAVECRIYAEDPTNQFLPSPGRILYLKEPSGPGIRHDCGIYSGWEVPIHYDPILAKLIVWAEDREAACRRMLAALEDYVLLGIHTPIPFLKDVIRHPVFREGKATTGFIKAHMEGWVEGAKDGEKRRLALAAAAYLALDRKPAYRPAAGGARESYSPWKSLGRWRQGE